MYIASGCIGEDEAEAGKELWENENPNRSITFSEIAVSLNIVRRGEKNKKKPNNFLHQEAQAIFFFSHLFLLFSLCSFLFIYFY